MNLGVSIIPAVKHIESREIGDFSAKAVIAAITSSTLRRLMWASLSS
jgi:hypothetical protein